MAQHDLSEELYGAVDQWADHDGFSAAERIAIEYGERFATDHQHIDQAFFDRLAEHFTPREIVELTISIGSWVGLGRVTQVLDAHQSCAIRL